MAAVEKALSSNASTVTPARMTEKGQPRIVTVERFIRDSKRDELSPAKRLATFESMLADDAVFSASNYTQLFSIKALAGGKFVGKKGSPVSKEAAKFLNYNLHNMRYGTWLEACRNMATAIIYGWSSQNIVATRRNYGEYKGSICLDKLSPRSPHSVYSWIWNEDFTEWRGLVQHPRLMQNKANRPYLAEGISEASVPKYYETDYPIILAEQLLHVSYNSTFNNPQGASPLMNAYESWYEKKLIEHFEMSGISKDLAGVLVVKVPFELIEKAKDPENYPDAAQELKDIQMDAADLHQGRNTHILLTSDVDPNTLKPLYDIELRGVTGTGGKSYITTNVIDQKRKAIYNCFGAGFLLLGQDGGGSYALSSAQTSVHGHLVERDIQQFADAINHQLAARLLAANKIELTFDEFPTFVPAEPDEVSLDDISKYVQRVASVGKLTPQSYKRILQLGNLPTKGYKKLDYDDSGDSRAGDGMATPFHGTSTGGGKAGDTSVGNTENT